MKALNTIDRAENEPRPAIEETESDNAVVEIR
jgi:hypothetical protein